MRELKPGRATIRGAAKGTSLNQVKPVRVLDTPVKEKFFYGLLEQAEE